MSIFDDIIKSVSKKGFEKSKEKIQLRKNKSILIDVDIYEVDRLLFLADSDNRIIRHKGKKEPIILKVEEIVEEQRKSDSETITLNKNDINEIVEAVNRIKSYRKFDGISKERTLEYFDSLLFFE